MGDLAITVTVPKVNLWGCGHILWFLILIVSSAVNRSAFGCKISNIPFVHKYNFDFFVNRETPDFISWWHHWFFFFFFWVSFVLWNIDCTVLVHRKSIFWFRVELLVFYFQESSLCDHLQHHFLILFSSRPVKRLFSGITLVWSTVRWANYHSTT